MVLELLLTQVREKSFNTAVESELSLQLLVLLLHAGTVNDDAEHEDGVDKKCKREKHDNSEHFSFLSEMVLIIALV